MQNSSAIKLRHISIKDYKGIEHLELDFPAPDLPGDPDVVVIGSENGLGKTSVLECCALLLNAKTHEIGSYGAEFLIRAGKSQSDINGLGGNSLDRFSTSIGQAGIQSGSSLLNQNSNDSGDILYKICGYYPNPVMENDWIFFHSYRKIPERSLEFAELSGKRRLNLWGGEAGSDDTPSIFKRIVLQSIIGEAGLFGSPMIDGSKKINKVLDGLLIKYTHCQRSELLLPRNTSDTIGISVQPTNGGSSFSFDGLSSGQKEIITTLFLIWYETRNQSKVVLIDEPELHLNTQWHRSFINSLLELAPQNQYIIATHSSTIMDSVDRSRRILLQGEKEAVR